MMPISHAVHSLITKLGNTVTIVSEADGQKARITAILQNDTGKSLRDSFSYTLRGKVPERLYTLIGMPGIPFDLDNGAQVIYSGNAYQILAHRYFCEEGKPIYLYALLMEEVKEDELL